MEAAERLDDQPFTIGDALLSAMEVHYVRERRRDPRESVSRSADTQVRTYVLRCSHVVESFGPDGTPKFCYVMSNEKLMPRLKATTKHLGWKHLRVYWVSDHRNMDPIVPYGLTLDKAIGRDKGETNPSR